MCVILHRRFYTHNTAMNNELMIVGAGIGGLAAALACAQQGTRVRVLEQAAQFSEVGAGVQIGPNGVRILQQWGLGSALKEVAAFPQRLEVRNAISGKRLAMLPLDTMPQRYGAAYATIARADLHGILLQALQPLNNVQMQLNTQLMQVAQLPDGLQVQVQNSHIAQTYSAPVLIGADGLWSRVRSAVLSDGAPRATGHVAFRAMVPQITLPVFLRSQVVTAWLGPRFHAVQYPVRGGEWLNLVAIVHSSAQQHNDWNQRASAAEVRASLGGAAAPLQDVLYAIDDWRMWVLRDRPPMRSAAEHAQGRVALLGDAAHPMRPYLAQGAGMAIEDAAALAKALSQSDLGVEAALQQFAQQRWQRNARVQQRAHKNGTIFHLNGLMRWGRDAALQLLGPRLLDMPWLYSK
jgi:salicylate hydroxylase